MTLTGQNFEVFQGDNKIIIITIRHADGQPVDLTGYNAVWCVHNVSPFSMIFTKTTNPGEGITVPTPANGQLVIDLTQLDTDNLTPKLYGHQCEIEDGLANHTTVLTGSMRVLRSITHNSF